MVMVIGLKSGKEFLVKDRGYGFEHGVTGEVTRVFESIDDKRLISIPPESSPIEYYDEEAKPELLALLQKDNTGVKEPVTEDTTSLYG